MTDLLLERITARVEHDEIGTIPFPDGLAPVPSKDFSPPPGAPMPRVDVVVVTYTTAEAEALADVLTPGVHHTDWVPYTRNWSVFESQLTGRSPAREAKCMAQYWPTTIGTKRVLAVHSETPSSHRWEVASCRCTVSTDRRGHWVLAGYHDRDGWRGGCD